MKLLTPEGQVQSDIALALIPAEEKAEKAKAFESCKSVKVGEQADTEFLRSLCLYKELKDLIV